MIQPTENMFYYELDWNVPNINQKKVYLAMKGLLGIPSLNIMSDGVGYKWKIEKNQKYKTITEEQFNDKARPDNIVYFFGGSRKYNELLKYPPKLQHYIELELYENRYKKFVNLSLENKIIVVKQKIDDVKKELLKKINKEKGLER